MKRSTSPRVPARPVATAAALLLLAVLAACSNSNSAGSGDGSAAGAGTSSSQVAAARAAVAKWKRPPTSIGVTEPLRTPPPAGKTFVWLNCELAACTEIRAGVEEATKAAGWNLKIVQYQQANTASLVGAFKVALGYHPTAVGLSGLPEQVWSSVIPSYRAAGVAIIAGYVGPLTLNDTVIGNVSGPPDGQLTGQILANWFIADSGGKGHALSVRTDDLPYLKTFNDAFAAEARAKCAGCKIRDLNTSVTQATGGKVNSAVVAELQRDRSIDYVIATEGPFINGLPAALAAAGLRGKVKIAGENGGVENLTAIKNGTEAAWTGASLHIGGWQYLDIAIRHAEGMKFDPYDGTQPKQLLTKDVEFTPTNDYDEPANYQEQFTKLWKLT